MELCTPCAGTRPGAADPTRSKAAYPPPRLRAYRKYEFLVLQGQKTLIFGAPGTKILIFGAPGTTMLAFGAPPQTENIDFWWSQGEGNSRGGWARTATGGILDPPQSLKNQRSKKIKKGRKGERENNLTRQARKRGGGLR